MQDKKIIGQTLQSEALQQSIQQMLSREEGDIYTLLLFDSKSLTYFSPLKSFQVGRSFLGKCEMKSQTLVILNDLKCKESKRP